MNVAIIFEKEKSRDCLSWYSGLESSRLFHVFLNFSVNLYNSNTFKKLIFPIKMNVISISCELKNSGHSSL